MRAKTPGSAHKRGDAICQLWMIAWLILEADTRHRVARAQRRPRVAVSPTARPARSTCRSCWAPDNLVILAARLRQDETDIVLRGGANCLLGGNEVVHDDAVRDVERSDERPELAVVARQDAPAQMQRDRA